MPGLLKLAPVLCAAAFIMSIWRDWLPPDLAEAANAEEAQRFVIVLHALAAEWEGNIHLSSATRSLETLKWVSVFKRYVRLPSVADCATSSVCITSARV